MIIKYADSRQPQIQQVMRLLSRPDLSSKQRELLAKEIHAIEQGERGESNSAYEIDFHLKNTQNWAVIHDLRIEYQSRVAQIDHLLINRLLEIYVVETKNFNADLQINEAGEFTAWYQKRPFGIPSPLIQNEKHIAVLSQLCQALPLPTRLGIKMMPSFFNVVMIGNQQRITRPKGLDTKNVIKVQKIKEWVTKGGDVSLVHALSSMAKVVSSETLMELAQTIANQHLPLKHDYHARFGIPRQAPAVPAPQAPTPAAVAADAAPEPAGKLTSSRLAAKLGFNNTQALINQLLALGYLERVEGKTRLTPAGKEAGGEFKYSAKFGPYFIWPESLDVNIKVE
ncbi:NERD domain-containing protein [Chromobacterium phragmitis]|uniref:nuclease-related domain-containing protein n=1 Tax=Chromobacterium amazonense TaxID=1382803 RepID=UPI0021B74747|nr:nuclease-related domain-containing protein [Chromobacterium amazonense]MBM2886820.1 NERD domain-containing protein [Chromobacterium amazonense]MDE1712027.1 nuclease-related domain-containing protein [Chromobacterium amazonense]